MRFELDNDPIRFAARVMPYVVIGISISAFMQLIFWYAIGLPGVLRLPLQWAFLHESMVRLIVRREHFLTEMIVWSAAYPILGVLLGTLMERNRKTRLSAVWKRASVSWLAAEVLITILGLGLMMLHILVMH